VSLECLTGIIMTLKPNYLLAFIKTFLWYFLLIAIMWGAVPYFQGKGVRVADILSEAALGGRDWLWVVSLLIYPIVSAKAHGPSAWWRLT
jgi:hypothetical protein